MFYRADFFPDTGTRSSSRAWMWRLHKYLQVMGAVVTRAMVERSHKGFAGHLQNIQCWVLVMDDDLKPVFAGNNGSKPSPVL